MNQLHNRHTDTDFEIRFVNEFGVNNASTTHRAWHNVKYLIAGILFGILLVKSEVISWFRIQEMFRFQEFHMYGVIGSAVVVGMLSVRLIKYFNIRTVDGEKIEFQSKKFKKGNVIGGLIFGFGWALTGACPGPLFAQIGTGAAVVSVTLLSAVAGTWVYGFFHDRLPH
ncbi:MAG TPA: DUF6691 family protein [Ohtaekwangia sp.]|nr:DUF6691 family protein [Ohtaekwangia sp.]